jgi:hypothetical protein
MFIIYESPPGMCSYIHSRGGTILGIGIAELGPDEFSIRLNSNLGGGDHTCLTGTVCIAALSNIPRIGLFNIGLIILGKTLAAFGVDPESGLLAVSPKEIFLWFISSSILRPTGA